jgi:hypothetical protein
MPGPFDRIFADIRKDVPSVPDAVLRQELFRVMDDFTQTTNIWQEHVVVRITPPTMTYAFTTHDGKPNRLLTVYEAKYEVNPLIEPPATPQLVPPNRYWPGGRVTMRVPGVIQLWNQPSFETDWAVVVAKRTSEPLGAENYPIIDDWIVDKYADTIGRGVLARLQLEPQKPYSNPMLASANQRAYYSGRSLARANDGHANVYGAQNWIYPQAWATVARKPWT